ncbi:MAG: Flp family type IVb pilin [Proteobacteria bacterium]|nr:Flp family type IVb pilin [Pseudomonadota bacterium]
MGLRKLWFNRSGVTAIEYALVAGLIAAVIIGSVTALGTHLTVAYNSVTNF